MYMFYTKGVIGYECDLLEKPKVDHSATSLREQTANVFFSYRFTMIKHNNNECTESAKPSQVTLHSVQSWILFMTVLLNIVCVS